MTGSPSYAHIKADVLAVITTVPRGKVTSFTAIAKCVGILPRHVATIIAGLDASEIERVPWHRVVADGGAIGRHPRRDEQMRRLRADGLPVSPVGIVGGLEGAMLVSVTRPGPGEQRDLPHAGVDGSGMTQVSEAGAARPSRARGRFDRPGTKLE